MREEQARRDEAARKHKELLESHLEKDPLRAGSHPETLSHREKIAFGPDNWTARREMAGILYVFLIVLVLAMGAAVLWLFYRPWQAVHPVEPEISERVLPAGSLQRVPLSGAVQQHRAAADHNLADLG